MPKYISQTSTPNLSEFDPTKIPYQIKVISDVRQEYDYSRGVHEVMLSGSVWKCEELIDGASRCYPLLAEYSRSRINWS